MSSSAGLASSVVIAGLGVGFGLLVLLGYAAVGLGAPLLAWIIVTSERPAGTEVPYAHLLGGRHDRTYPVALLRVGAAETAMRTPPPPRFTRTSD